MSAVTFFKRLVTSSPLFRSLKSACRAELSEPDVSVCLALPSPNKSKLKRYGCLINVKPTWRGWRRCLNTVLDSNHHTTYRGSRFSNRSTSDQTAWRRLSSLEYRKWLRNKIRMYGMRIPGQPSGMMLTNIFLQGVQNIAPALCPIRMDWIRLVLGPNTIHKEHRSIEHLFHERCRSWRLNLRENVINHREHKPRWSSSQLPYLKAYMFKKLNKH